MENGGSARNLKLGRLAGGNRNRDGRPTGRWSYAVAVRPTRPTLNKRSVRFGDGLESETALKRFVLPGVADGALP